MSVIDEAKLPETITFDMQPYGVVTLNRLSVVQNQNVATSQDLIGHAVSGVERSYLGGHVAVSKVDVGRQYRVYGIKQRELDDGHIVRVAM